MKPYKILTALFFILIPLNSLIADPKEDYDKLNKDLIEAQAANKIAQKAWFDYKRKATFPAMSAEESKKVSEANRKLKEAKKNHPELSDLNKAVAAAQEKYGSAKRAKIDAKAKNVPQEQQDALKAQETEAKKEMYAATRKQSSKAKSLKELQKLKAEEDEVVSKARATRYAADPQAKSLYARSQETSEECTRLSSELKALKLKK